MRNQPQSRKIIIVILYISQILIFVLAYWIANSIITTNNIVDTKPVAMFNGYLINHNVRTVTATPGTVLPSEKVPFPSQAQMVLFTAFIIAFIICLIYTSVIKKLSHTEGRLITNAPVHDFAITYSIAIALTLSLLYLIFDPLISTAVYLAFFIFLLFFRDYRAEEDSQGG